MWCAQTLRRIASTFRRIASTFRRFLSLLSRGVRHAFRIVSTRNFITLHHAYFIVTCLVFSAVFYGISRPHGSVSYIDSLFLVVSAMTLTGLNTVNLSTVNTAQQLILFFLIIFGSAIFVSSFVVLVRKRAFEHRFAHIAELRRLKSENHGLSLRRRLSTLSRTNTQDNARRLYSIDSRGGATDAVAPTHERPVTQGDSHNPEDQEPAIHPVPTLENTNDGAHITFDQLITSKDFRPQTGPLARTTSANQSAATGAVPSEKRPTSAPHGPALFKTASVSRNSQFHHLSEKERKQLGGYEYKTIRFLSWLVPTYFILFQLLGCLGLGAYVAYNRPTTALENGLNPWWVGSFNAVSAFNNSGMSLLDANMVAFQTSVYMLLTMILLILAGNTCYPIFLRFIVWALFKLIPTGEQWEDHRRTLQFLLDHPRRCYTNMFPQKHTWWLFFAVITLNCVDWVAFELLNLGNKAIEHLPVGFRILDGLFQAFAVRSGGFYVVPISTVRISLQVLYVIMMYISVYPVVITMRNTNPYEERSLGIYADDPDYIASRSQSKQGYFARLLTTTPFDETTQYFVRHQLRAQLSHDLWSIVLAVFVITCFEASKFERDPTVFSVFNILFETISAYGCVGISVGLPDQAYSFAGSFTTCSKLVLCAVMIRGRHRGLPVAIDKAISLPREEVDEAEEDDALIRLEKNASRGRTV